MVPHRLQLSIINRRNMKLKDLLRSFTSSKTLCSSVISRNREGTSKAEHRSYTRDATGNTNEQLLDQRSAKLKLGIEGYLQKRGGHNRDLRKVVNTRANCSSRRLFV